MDDDSCVLKYIEIVPLDNNAEQTEDLMPFEVKVCIVSNLVTFEMEVHCSCEDPVLLYASADLCPPVTARPDIHFSCQILENCN